MTYDPPPFHRTARPLALNSRRPRPFVPGVRIRAVVVVAVVALIALTLLILPGCGATPRTARVCIVTLQFTRTAGWNDLVADSVRMAATDPSYECPKADSAWVLR